MNIVLWFWEQKGVTGRWRQLGWRMTDEDARQYAEKNNVELRKVEGSREERTNLYGERGYGSVPPASGK